MGQQCQDFDDAYSGNTSLIIMQFCVSRNNTTPLRLCLDEMSSLIFLQFYPGSAQRPRHVQKHLVWVFDNLVQQELFKLTWGEGGAVFTMRKKHLLNGRASLSATGDSSICHLNTGPTSATSASHLN